MLWTWCCASPKRVQRIVDTATRCRSLCSSWCSILLFHAINTRCGPIRSSGSIYISRSRWRCTLRCFLLTKKEGHCKVFPRIFSSSWIDNPMILADWDEQMAGISRMAAMEIGVYGRDLGYWQWARGVSAVDAIICKTIRRLSSRELSDHGEATFVVSHQE